MYNTHFKRSMCRINLFRIPRGQRADDCAQLQAQSDISKKFQMKRAVFIELKFKILTKPALYTIVTVICLQRLLWPGHSLRSAARSDGHVVHQD